MDRFKPPTPKEQNDYPLCEDCENSRGWYSSRFSLMLCDYCFEDREREKREQIE
jgi:hypothetical protein